MSETQPTLIDLIGRARTRVGEVLPGTSEHGRRLIIWARACAGSWRALPSQEEVVEAHNFVDRCRAQQPQPPGFDILYEIADFLLSAGVCRCNGQLSALAAGVGAAEELRERGRLKPGSGSYATMAVSEAALRLQRFELSLDALDLERVISQVTTVVNTKPERVLQEDRFEALLMLCQAARARAQLGGKPSDLSLAMEAALLGFNSEVSAASKGLFVAQYSMALRSRIRFGDVDLASLDEAIAASKGVLTAYGVENLDQAELLDHLGSLADSRYRLTGSDADLEAAIAYSRRAIAVLEGNPVDVVARVHANLSLSLLQLAVLHRESDVLWEALGICSEGLALPHVSNARAADLHEMRSQALLMLNALAPSKKCLDNAIDAASAAHTLVRQDEDAKPALYQLVSGAHGASGVARLIGALLQRGDEGDIERAFFAGEAAKSMLLVRSLFAHDVPARDLPEGLIALERSIAGKIAALNAVDLERGWSDSDEGERSRRMLLRRENWSALQAVWVELAGMGEEGQRYVTMRSSPEALVKRQINEMPAETLALSFVETLQVSEDLKWSVDYCVLVHESPGFVHIAGRIPKRDVNKLVSDLSEHVATGAEAPVSSETWWQPIARLGALPRTAPRRVVLSPARGLESIPWAVALERAGWFTLDGSQSLTVLPSLAAFSDPTPGSPDDLLSRTVYAVDAQDSLRMLLVSANPLVEPALVMANPTRDLPWSELEGDTVAAIVGVKAVSRRDAKRSVLLAGLSSAEVVHLAAHIKFDDQDPLDSRIYVADGIVQAREILRLKSKPRFVVLSCCEGGIGGIFGSEVLGLVAALLHGGVSTVVASLWEVDDRSTGLLMEQFYRLLREGMPAAAALPRAMSAIRTQAGRESTWHWGGFQVFSREADARVQLPVRHPS